MGVPQRRFQKWKDDSKYDFAGCKYHFGMFWGAGNLRNLREIGKIYNLEGNLGNAQGEKKRLENKKSVAEIEEGGGLIQHPNGNGELIKKPQGKIRK